MRVPAPRMKGVSMRAPSALVVSVMAAGAVLAAAAGGQETAPTFKAGNRTVAVYATVTGADGRLVPNLAREAFSILDNGRRQDLTLFSSDVQPITVVMMLDRSGSMRGNFALVQQAAERFVAADAARRQGAHRELLERHSGRSARVHVGPRRAAARAAHGAAGRGAHAALERRQRGHHGAACVSRAAASCWCSPTAWTAR